MFDFDEKLVKNLFSGPWAISDNAWNPHLQNKKNAPTEASVNQFFEGQLLPTETQPYVPDLQPRVMYNSPTFGFISSDISPLLSKHPHNRIVRPLPSISNLCLPNFSKISDTIPNPLPKLHNQQSQIYQSLFHPSLVSPLPTLPFFDNNPEPTQNRFHEWKVEREWIEKDADSGERMIKYAEKDEQSCHPSQPFHIDDSPLTSNELTLRSTTEEEKIIHFGTSHSVAEDELIDYLQSDSFASYKSEISHNKLRKFSSRDKQELIRLHRLIEIKDHQIILLHEQLQLAKKKIDELNIPSFICPISQEIMREPVLIVESQMVYDKSSIIEWFKISNTDPSTNVELKSKEFIPLRAFKSSIEEWRNI